MNNKMEPVYLLNRGVSDMSDSESGAMDVDTIFEQYIPSKLKENLADIRDFDATFKFIVSGDDAATWVIDLSGDEPSVMKSDKDADCTLTIDSTILREIISGKANPLTAYMDGQILFEGDMEKAAAMGLIL